MTLKQVLHKYRNEYRGILAANAYNYETIKAIVLGAKENNEPIIIQIAQSTIKYLGIKITKYIFDTLKKQYDVPAWIHLDHGTDMEMIKQAINIGFDSVMIDASKLPMEKNIQITREVVKMARKRNILVEAELGYVPKLGESSEDIEFTDIETATYFVEKTGVDTLAVSVGTVHGFYKSTPEINYQRIKEIRQGVNIPLVLHGTSGLSDLQLKKVIKSGITKINLATEIKKTFTEKLKQQLTETDEIDPRKYMPEVIKSVSKLIISKQKVISQ